MHRKKQDILQPFWSPFSWNEEGEGGAPLANLSGLNIYEEESSIFIEASLPGLSAADIEVSQDHGMIVIEGKKEEAKKERKYYHKASTAFCYQVPVLFSVDKDIYTFKLKS